MPKEKLLKIINQIHIECLGRMKKISSPMKNLKRKPKQKMMKSILMILFMMMILIRMILIHLKLKEEVTHLRSVVEVLEVVLRIVHLKRLSQFRIDKRILRGVKLILCSYLIELMKKRKEIARIHHSQIFLKEVVFIKARIE